MPQLPLQLSGEVISIVRLEMSSATDNHSLAAGMNGGVSLACDGHAKLAVSALTAAGNAQPPQSQKDITVEPELKVPTRAPCPDSCCEQPQPPNEPSSKHHSCNDERGQSQEQSAKEQLCEWRAKSAAQVNGATGQAKDTDHDSQPEKQPICEQHTPADMTSGVDVIVEDASLTSQCNCRVLQQARQWSVTAAAATTIGRGDNDFR